MIYLIFLSFFCCVLGLFPFVCFKATHCPGAISFLGTFFCILLHREPSLCWPLASSGSSGFPTWFGRPCPLAFYDPSHFRAGNIHGKNYVWQNLISNSSCGEVDLLEIIGERVSVEHFFRPFGEISKGKLTILTSLHLLSSTTLLLVRGFPSSSVTR